MRNRAIALSVLASALAFCAAAVVSCSKSPSDAPADDAGDVDAASEAAPLGTPLPWSKDAIGHLPQDDTLRVHHVQAKGTHNSYHVETPGNRQADWHYTMPPIDTQLDLLGVRQLEIDVHLASLDDEFKVFHIQYLDEGTTCATFRDCLGVIGRWSGAHPNHQPLYIQIEPKTGFTTEKADAFFARLEAEILSVLVRERIVTPDEVQGDAPTLGGAVAQRGWPTLGQTRGRIIFAMDDHGDVRAAYTRGSTSLKGRLLFSDSRPGEPLAAVAILNDPVGDAAQIRAALAANMIVRTDADDLPANADDKSAKARLASALASGATWLSTNFPGPVDFRAYYAIIPGGTPSRCSPVTAPPSCTPLDIDDLGPRADADAGPDGAPDDGGGE